MIPKSLSSVPDCIAISRFLQSGDLHSTKKDSDHPIDSIFQQTCTKPENREMFRVPPPEKGKANDIIGSEMEAFLLGLGI